MRDAIEIQSYLEAESLFNMAIASYTVVINCAGKMMVEFFPVASLERAFLRVLDGMPGGPKDLPPKSTVH